MPTYTYSGDPTTSDKDAVRYKLTDTGPYPAGSSTDPTGWEFANQEIDYELSKGSSVTRTASRMARVLALRYMKQPMTKKVGDLTITNSLYLKGEMYLKIADDLDKEAGRYDVGAGSLYAGGVSLPQKQSNVANPSLTKPDFRKDLFDRQSDQGVGEGYPPYSGGSST